MARAGLRGRIQMLGQESLDNYSRGTMERLEASQFSSVHQDVVALSYEVSIDQLWLYIFVN